MVAAILPNLITELDGAVKTGSPERTDRILKHVASLVLSNADRLGDAELGVLPLDDATLGQMKREKLHAKDRLIRMYDSTH